MHPSRAIHRSPSSTTASRAWAAAQNADCDRIDPEAAALAVGSPKKVDIPSHRRKRPLALMFFVLLGTSLMGAALFFSRKDTYSDGTAVPPAVAATAQGPSIAPQQAWNLMNIHTFHSKAGYDTVPGSAYVEFTVPGLFVPLKDALDLLFPIQSEELQLQESPTTTLQESPTTTLQGDDVNAGAKITNENSGGGGGGDSLRASFNSIWSENPLNNSTNFVLGGGDKRRGKSRHLSSQDYNRKLQEQHDTQPPQQQHSTLHAAFSNGAGTPETWIQPEGIRLLVTVTSACCTQVSLQRRAAIRRTWAALIKERYPSAGAINIQFFLAQPENKAVLTEWLPALEEEIIAHNDTVVLRGKDAYLNLPNKTFRMLRYVLAHSSEYTHVLKADDDTWVRMHKILDYLHEASGKMDGTAQGGESSEQASAPGVGVAAIAAAIQRKAELERMSKDRGAPIVSEGMTLYDASTIVQRVDQDQKKAMETVDDIDGSRLTLEELAKRSNWYANRARDAMFEGELARKTSNGGNNDDPRFDRGEKEVEKGNQESDESADGPLKKSRRQLQQLQQQQEERGKEKYPHFTTKPRMSGVYLGCIENQKGFQPIRDKNNKWYVSNEELPDDSYPHNVKYLAGWGYVLSRDLVMHIVQKVNSYERQPENAPIWYNRIAFEDVLVGLLLHDVVPLPETHSGFRPAWRSCVPDTAVRHLDIDSPRLLKALVEQDISGLSDEKPVQCSSGQFLPGDYAGWYAWRSTLRS